MGKPYPVGIIRGSVYKGPDHLQIDIAGAKSRLSHQDNLRKGCQSINHIYMYY